MKDLIKKIRSKRGESMAEVLVAGLVISLGLIMVVSAVNAATSMVKKSRDRVSNYISIRNKVENENMASATTLSSQIVVNGSGIEAFQIYVNIDIQTLNDKNGRPVFSLFEESEP
jgi:Tfp pilus assembly protein PilV